MRITNMKTKVFQIPDQIQQWFQAHRDKVRRVLFYITIAAGLLLIFSFIFRNALFTWYLDKKVDAFNRHFHAEFKVNKARITGLSGVELDHLLLKPVNGEVLLTADKVYASVNFWRLLIGRISLTDFELENTTLNLIRNDSLTNYMFLLDRRAAKKDTISSGEGGNYALRAERLLDAAFDKIPNRLKIINFTIRSQNNDHLVTMHLDTLDILDQQFTMPIYIQENDIKAKWMMSGVLDKGARQARVKLVSEDTSGIVIPFIQYKWKADVRFDSAQITLSEEEGADGITRIEGQAFVNNLRVRHERISTETVQIHESGMQYRINIGKDYIELDSSTSIRLNQLSLNPYLRYRPKPEKQITLKVHKERFPAMELFSSLPVGLFDNFRDFRASGDLAFDLDFFVDLSIPDSLRFFCDLIPYDFRIQSYGQGNFRKLNESFEYTAYERGQAVRTFAVGPENPDFRSLDQISDYLKVSVLNSEDGAFFGHQGFMPEAFRESIVTNIKERRFARGGSTISMQLVKNVFLNRNKTIVRKIEEALIVWMIERMRLSSKDRMFEVYLNIIEWGPMVYGANEAARFYFAKDVSRLSLAEAIFMASIIPRPKGFMYAFEPNGDFKEYLKNYYGRISEKMLRKEQITPLDYDLLLPFVDLKGPAKGLLKKADTLQFIPDFNPEDDLRNPENE